MVLNKVSKFHKNLIKSIQRREGTSFQMVNFHKQRAIITESMVQYKQLSNLKKTSWYLTMWPSFIKFWQKIFDLESGHHFKWWIFINKGPLYKLMKAWCDPGVRYGPLSNLKRTSWYLTMWPSFIKFWSKVIDLESGCRWTDVWTCVLKYYVRRYRWTDGQE